MKISLEMQRLIVCWLLTIAPTTAGLESEPPTTASAFIDLINFSDGWPDSAVELPVRLNDQSLQHPTAGITRRLIRHDDYDSHHELLDGQLNGYERSTSSDEPGSLKQHTSSTNDYPSSFDIYETFIPREPRTPRFPVVQEQPWVPQHVEEKRESSELVDEDEDSLEEGEIRQLKRPSRESIQRLVRLKRTKSTPTVLQVSGLLGEVDQATDSPYTRELIQRVETSASSGLSGPLGIYLRHSLIDILKAQLDTEDLVSISKRDVVTFFNEKYKAPGLPAETRPGKERQPYGSTEKIRGKDYEKFLNLAMEDHEYLQTLYTKTMAEDLQVFHRELQVNFQMALESEEEVDMARVALDRTWYLLSSSLAYVKMINSVILESTKEIDRRKQMIVQQETAYEYFRNVLLACTSSESKSISVVKTESGIESKRHQRIGIIHRWLLRPGLTTNENGAIWTLIELYILEYRGGELEKIIEEFPSNKNFKSFFNDLYGITIDYIRLESDMFQLYLSDRGLKT